MRITDFKNYKEYCTYLAVNYGKNVQLNREIEDNGLLKERAINLNGEPWASYTREEFFALKFVKFLTLNKYNMADEEALKFALGIYNQTLTAKNL